VSSSHFAAEDYLAMMAVHFVRRRQYTVIPYLYHLINLFVGTVRRHELDT
jgi:hypothetical protein